MRAFWIGLLFLGLSVALTPAMGAESAYAPRIAPASKDGEIAIAKFRIPAGMQVELFAAEPLLANPVAFCIDEKQRFYVCETFRLHAGVTDTRSHMYWLDDDLACRTIEDRLRMYRKHLGDKFPTYGVEHDRLRLIEDRDGDGKAETASVFADGFHQPEAGIGASVLARDGAVYYACVPDLWRFKDTQNAGKADVREKLHTGFGVHVGFLGHDLHGLRFGPDGKLYFSIGDRGFRVQAGARLLDNPDTGAVLRCEPDGSELEIFHLGLRNPQELAFDDFGNLFTVDNNSDSGDQARLVHLIDGGDSGWRIGYQFHDMPTSRGPWNAELLWKPKWKGQAAYHLPPLANFTDGPSGLTYYPGLGLPERYRGHFFLADFRGTPTNSGIRSFAVKPAGASFELTDSHEFLWSVLATDVEFGYDGCLYFSDWVDGWEKPNRGRIYRVSHGPSRKDPRIEPARKRIAESFASQSTAELMALLDHADQRVRQSAQFALAGRGADSIAPLAKLAGASGPTLPRLHAVWALGQIGKRTPTALAGLKPLLTDTDPEIRGQSAKTLGDRGARDAWEAITKLLADKNPRVRFLAAIGLSKIATPASIPAICEFLKSAGDDVYLRHAGVLALAGAGSPDELAKIGNDSSIAVRMGTLLALRRLQSPLVAIFLEDVEIDLVTEAARAIHDAPIDSALPHLAKLIGRSGMPEPLAYRVLSANFRLGSAEHLRGVAEFAARDGYADAVREEALKQIGMWNKPPGRDRIQGLWRPVASRSLDVAATLKESLPALLGGKSDAVRKSAIQLAGALGIREAANELVRLVENDKQSPTTRADALFALNRLEDRRVENLARSAVLSTEPNLRIRGVQILAQRQPNDALEILGRTLQVGVLAEKQNALATLGGLKKTEAGEILSTTFVKFQNRQLEEELALELLEAIKSRPEPALQRSLSAYEAGLSKLPPVQRFRETLKGGDASRGEKIFREKSAVSCVRCHRINNRGGAVGPDLSKLGGQKPREYLLEAIVDPNKEIAKGFETVVLALDDGQIVTGVLRSENDQQILLVSPNGESLAINKANVETRTRGKSAMPEDLLKNLTKAELRDLIEFLSQQK